ncbi:MAG: ATP synthase F0 subunit B [Geobacteraceae bacterium]|nr:ATP synthase F0 subunit B [Geobacteraceae bacterium]
MKRRPMTAPGKALVLAVLAFLIALAGVAGIACAAEAAHHADSTAQLKDFGYRLLSFSILVAILAWGAKKANIKGLLASRQATVAKALQEAAEARQAAEDKLAEYSEKLDKATLEIDSIQKAIRQEGEAEKARIIAEANESAERIREQAKAYAQQEVQMAMARLRAETSRLAVSLAEESLRRSVTPADQERFVDEYLNKVVEVH